MTETWLTSNFSSSEIFLPRYTIIRAERTLNNSLSRHGGVLIGISSEFNFTVNDLSQFSLTISESFLWVSITIQDNELNIYCLYNPPTKSKYRIPQNELNDLFQHISNTKPHQPCYIVGDLNLPNMDWESLSSPDEYEDKIAQTFSVLNWTQLIDFPTVGKNTFDVAITKSPESVISLEIAEAFKNHFVSTNNRYLSEHIPIMIDVSWKNEYTSKTSIVKAFSFCRGDYSLLRNLMTQTPFTPNCYSNTDVMVDEWYSWSLYLLQKSVPIRTKHRQSLPPWISPSTSNIMKRKETAIKKLNRGVRPSSDSILKVQKLSQEIEEAVTHDKREYGISLCDSRNLATIFKYINFVKSDRSALPTLLNNGNSAVTDREKADLLNEYFISVFVNPNGVDSNHTITIPSDMYYQRLLH